MQIERQSTNGTALSPKTALLQNQAESFSSAAPKGALEQLVSHKLP